MKKYSKPNLKTEKGEKACKVIACRCSGSSTHRK